MIRLFSMLSAQVLPWARPLGAVAAAVFLFASGAMVPGAARAASEVVIQEEGAYPESVTSTRDGVLIAGSIAGRGIYRAGPGEVSAKPWIDPSAHGIPGVFGVLADERAGLLWACSAGLGKDAPPSALYGFDLETGALKHRLPLPTAGALCSDIALGDDEALYVADANNMEILRLERGGAALTVWAGGGELGKKGEVLDGIAVLKGRVFVNTFLSGKLMAVTIGRAGAAGAVVQIGLDRPLVRPDGMRTWRGRLVLTETTPSGRLSMVTLAKDRGVVITLAETFSSPPNAVTVVGDTAFVLEGQLGKRATAGQPADRFAITPVALPIPGKRR